MAYTSTFQHYTENSYDQIDLRAPAQMCHYILYYKLSSDTGKLTVYPGQILNSYYIIVKNSIVAQRRERDLTVDLQYVDSG